MKGQITNLDDNVPLLRREIQSAAVTDLADDELMCVLACLYIVDVADIDQRDDLRSSTHLCAEGFFLREIVKLAIIERVRLVLTVVTRRWFVAISRDTGMRIG